YADAPAVRIPWPAGACGRASSGTRSAGHVVENRTGLDRSIGRSVDSPVGERPVRRHRAASRRFSQRARRRPPTHGSGAGTLASALEDPGLQARFCRALIVTSSARRLAVWIAFAIALLAGAAFAAAWRIDAPEMPVALIVRKDV